MGGWWGRKPATSLALDLVEEVRSIITGAVVLRCLNNSILQPGHFLLGEGDLRVLLIQVYQLAGTLDLQGQGGVYQPFLVR